MWQSSHVTANNFNAVLTSFCNGIKIIFSLVFLFFFVPRFPFAIKIKRN